MRRAEEGSLHDLVVIEVARRKLSFPNRPELRTYSNPNQQHNMGVNIPGDGTVYPDVVVVNIREGHAQKIGEVEAAGSINETSAAQWRRYSNLVRSFYLYVPEGFEQEAFRLIRTFAVRVTGLRTYRIENSEVVFEKVDVGPGPPYSAWEIRPRPPPEPPIQRPEPEPDD